MPEVSTENVQGKAFLHRFWKIPKTQKLKTEMNKSKIPKFSKNSGIWAFYSQDIPGIYYPRKWGFKLNKWTGPYDWRYLKYRILLDRAFSARNLMNWDRPGLFVPKFSLDQSGAAKRLTSLIPTKAFKKKSLKSCNWFFPLWWDRSLRSRFSRRSICRYKWI